MKASSMNIPPNDQRTFPSFGGGFEMDGWRPFPSAVLLGDSIYPKKDWLIPMVEVEEWKRSWVSVIKCN